MSMGKVPNNKYQKCPVSSQLILTFVVAAPHCLKPHFHSVEDPWKHCGFILQPLD